MKQFLCACFALLSVASCYSLPYSPYNQIVLSSHTCDEGEVRLAEKSVPKDERWKVDALLAQCYVDSAWLALSAINAEIDHNYFSIEQDCQKALEHFGSISDFHKDDSVVVKIGQDIGFTCFSLLERIKSDNLERKFYFQERIPENNSENMR